ncbi:SAV_915 family protein [Streptomyces sp. NPDC004609]|uniref:SAV_915 family protein n=1 Tax=Streptomyces sp. NPDC004609 TaxID=3364704 RepID=UPI0036B9AFB1
MDTLTREDAETADPDERRPAGPLYVPVRLGSAGGHQLRFMRTPLGVRTAVGFTSRERLAAVLGADQRWIRLAAPALRTLAEPLGVTMLTVDPQLSAPTPVPSLSSAPAPDTLVHPASARPPLPARASVRPSAHEPDQRPVRPCARRDGWDRDAMGVLRVTGAAAFVWSAVTAVHAFLD